MDLSPSLTGTSPEQSTVGPPTHGLTGSQGTIVSIVGDMKSRTDRTDHRLADSANQRDVSRPNPSPIPKSPPL